MPEWARLGYIGRRGRFTFQKGVLFYLPRVGFCFLGHTEELLWSLWLGHAEIDGWAAGWCCGWLSVKGSGRWTRVVVVVVVVVVVAVPSGWVPRQESHVS